MTTPTPPRALSWWRRLRPGRRTALVIGGVLVIGIIGVVAALLIPGGDRWDDDHDRPGIGMVGDAGPDGLGAHERDGDVDRPGPGPGGRDAEDRDDLDDAPLLVGSVVSVGDGTIVVTPDGGTDRTLRTDDDTRVNGGDNGSLGDLQAGERVVIRVDGSGDTATAESIQVPTAQVAGTVTALTGTSATVVAVDGRTLTADLTAVSRQPVVGDLVQLDGVIGPDGSTLVADGIEILDRAA